MEVIIKTKKEVTETMKVPNYFTLGGTPQKALNDGRVLRVYKNSIIIGELDAWEIRSLTPITKEEFKDAFETTINSLNNMVYGR